MMWSKLTAAATLAMTMACAPAPAAPEMDDGPERYPGGGCEASKAQALVGQPASSELAAKAQQLSGATAVRWLKPGQMVTMEYRADRLNIELDEQNLVVAIRCG